MIQAVVQFLRRQSAWLALSLLLFAVLNGAYVSQGIWQGTGLHGYIIEPGAKGGPPRVVSVWSALIWLLVFLGLAIVFGLSALRHSRIQIGFGTRTTKQAESMETANRQSTLRRRRKQAKHH